LAGTSTRNNDARYYWGETMYQQPTAPRSVGGVLDDAIRLFIRTVRYWWLPGLLIAAVSGLIQIYIAAAAGGARQTPQQMLAMLSSPSIWLAYLLLLFGSVYFYLVMYASINAVAGGHEPALGEGYAIAWRAMPRQILAGIMMMLATVGGLILLVLPGIWIAVGMCLSPVVIVAEQPTASKALARSWHLVKGNWWRTFGVIVIAGILLVVLQWVVVMLVTVGFGLAAAGSKPDIAVITITLQLAVAVVRFITAGLLPAATVALYRDLRLRRDGDDLEARVSGLTTA
jgi:hypothetical protein